MSHNAAIEPALHEFVPFKLYPQDKPDHVCNGGCFCADCGQRKSSRPHHYQTRDKRRPREDNDGPSAGSQTTPAVNESSEDVEME